MRHRNGKRPCRAGPAAWGDPDAEARGTERQAGGDSWPAGISSARWRRRFELLAWPSGQTVPGRGWRRPDADEPAWWLGASEGQPGPLRADRDQGAARTGIMIWLTDRAHRFRNHGHEARRDAVRRAGIRISMLPAPLPTPVLAFTVRHEHTGYGRDGDCQPQPAPVQRDQGLRARWRPAAATGRRGDRRRHRRGGPAAPARGLGRGAVRVQRQARTNPCNAYVSGRGRPTGRAAPGMRPQLKVVHTAMHGVGDGTLRAVLATAGWPAPVPVVAQQQPDAAFPTLPYPNPEAPGALDLARETAEQVGADLVLATDPDADRLAVMVPGPAGWQALTGDELEALLGDAVLARLARGEPVADAGGRPPVVATTVVSGSLLRRLADAAGVRCVHDADGVQVDRPGRRRRRPADLRLRAGHRLCRAAGPGGRQGRDQRGAAGSPAGGRRKRSATAHPARPARRHRAGPRPARHPASGCCTRTARRGLPSSPTRSNTSGRSRRALLDGQPVTVTDLRDGAPGRGGPGRRSR